MKKLLLSLALSVLVISGCENKEDDNINKAQKCLDKATQPSDAANCLSVIEGINNPKANRIRCALLILDSGTTQDDIIDAFQAMDSGAEDPVIEVATILGLGDYDGQNGVDSADVNHAKSIKDVCYQSESIGLKTISQLIVFGTTAQQYATDPSDPSDIAANIGDMNDDDAGNFAIDVYNLYCVPTYSNEDICKTLDAAGVVSGDPTQVGADLKTCLETNNCN